MTDIIKSETGVACVGLAKASRASSPEDGLRILVADDNAINLKVAVMMLSRLGYRADVAVNGLEVLNSLERCDYDVIFMDIQMPVMDGLEATRRIRAGNSARRMPQIIAMTANAMQGDRETCLAAGMNDYLSKPVKLEDIRAALDSCQKRSRAAAVESASDRLLTLDPAIIESLRSFQSEGEPDLLVELVGIFLEDAPERIGSLRKALAVGDGREIARLAHSLKGICANQGAQRMAAICAEIEKRAASGALENLFETIFLLEQEFARVQRALEEVFASCN